LRAATAAQAQDAIRLAVTDIDGAESLQREFGPFKAAWRFALVVAVEQVGGALRRRRDNACVCTQI
jgi:hypothetical protein